MEGYFILKKLSKIITKSIEEISLKHLPLKGTTVHTKTKVYSSHRRRKLNEIRKIATSRSNKEREISDSVSLYDNNGKSYDLNIVDILKISDIELDDKLNKHLTQIFGNNNVKHDPDFYTYAKGDNPICLIAHIDTLKRTTNKIGYRSENIIGDIEKPINDEIVKNKEVLGADDRAGIFAALKVLDHCIKNNINKPSIIFSNLEETGGLGMKALIERDIFDHNKTNLLLSLDRKGSDEYVYYTNKIPEEIHQYMKDNGFKKNYGIYSDGLDLAVHTKIPNVNVSVGYHNPHTSHEYLNKKEMNSTINKIMNMVENPINEKYLLKAE